MILVTGNLLGLVLDLATSEESLGIGFLVEDDTKACGHISDIAIWIKVYVLTRVLASVAINVLQGVSCIWLRWIRFWMIIGLGDLTFPWLNSHELFALNLFYFLELKKVIFRSIVVVELFNFSSDLVSTHSTIDDFIVHLLIFGPSFCTSLGFS